MAQTTMCDKIQTIGTNLQNNLNARGVTCTFGNTNGHTIYDLAQLINEKNLKGIGDTNLKIMASNPYCVSGDATDIIVLLRDGVGTPIANQEVTVSDGTNEHTLTTDANGKATLYNQGITQDKTYTATYNTFSDSCIVEYCTFVDYAVTNNANPNYVVGNAITKTVGQNYTTLSTDNANSTTGRTYSTQQFSGDIELLFEANVVNYAISWAFYFGFRNGSTHSIARLYNTGWKYLKFQRKNGVCTAYRSADNINWETLTLFEDNVGNTDVNIELYIYSPVANSVQFKNVRVNTL